MFSAKSMRRSAVCSILAIAAVVGNSAFAGASGPQMLLTGNGTTGGFSLTTFASGLPTVNGGDNNPDPFGVGTLGVAVDPYNRVYVTDYANGGFYVFPTRTDGQNASDPGVQVAVFGTNTGYGFANATGISEANGQIYGAAKGASRLWSIGTNGYFNQDLWPGIWHQDQGVATNPNTTMTYGTDPVHPTLFVSLAQFTDFNSVFHPGEIEYVDPVQAALGQNAHPGTGRFITSSSTTSPDSLVLSADGSEIYSAWSDGTIRRFSTAFDPITLQPVADFNNPDWEMSGAGGLALGTGNLLGKLFLSTSVGGVGQVDEIDIATKAVTVLASGGGYPGYLTADPVDGSLYVSSSGTVYRLAAPANGGFLAAAEPAVSAAPEPASLTLLGLGGLAIVSLRSKRRAK